MNEAEALAKFGVIPPPDQRLEIRQLLEGEIARYDLEQAADEFIKLLCVQLFAGSRVEDSLLIWQAKQLSFDLGCSIDVQLLCGAGLEPTKQFLAAHPSEDARAALDYIRHCESVQNFDGFSPESYRAEYRRYYGPA